MKKIGLILIDVQNDYTSKGAFPLWNMNQTLEKMKKIIEHAKKNDWQIVVIEHHSPKGPQGDFLTENTWGAETIKEIKDLLPDNAVIVRKTFASSFANTNLEEVLSKAKVTDLYLGGFMTQHCVTHTTLDKTIAKYNSATVIGDICSSLSEVVHQIAMSGFAPYIPVVNTKDIAS